MIYSASVTNIIQHFASYCATPSDYFPSENIHLICSFCTTYFPIWIWKPRARIRVRIFLYAIFAGVADIFNNTFNNIQMRHFGTRLKPNIYTILKEMFDLLVVKYNSLRIILRYYVYSKGTSISSLVSFKVVLIGVLTCLPLSRTHLNKILSILHLCQKKIPFDFWFIYNPKKVLTHPKYSFQI